MPMSRPDDSAARGKFAEGAGTHSGLAGGRAIPGGAGIGGGFGGGGLGAPGLPAAPPPALTDPSLTRDGAKRSSEPAKVEDVAKKIAQKPGDTSKARGGHEGDRLDKVQTELEKFNKDLKARTRTAGEKSDPKMDAEAKATEELAERMLRSVKDARDNITNFETARQWYANGSTSRPRAAKVGVDVAVAPTTCAARPADPDGQQVGPGGATAWSSAASGLTRALQPT